ncbi:hypothetical protein Q4E40_11740 [Pontibacter sp. BT731]|uniref:hypothetical protein n=1 Tax=Pontibacter coccineus TaxID=3063328 RepID=UPI0026E2342D|nr:hypothetical protein [Pontibacter sp. BT731]MDO6390802.1 hypothetical protein [Pontibacter sp. BT731]
MKSLILYSQGGLKGISKVDNIVILCLAAVAIPVGVNKYGLYVTAVVVFIFYAAFTLFEIVFSGKEIFTFKNLKKKNSIEQGRLIYHLIALTVVICGLLYLDDRTVYILVAGLTIVMCFATGISLLSLKFKK